MRAAFAISDKQERTAAVAAARDAIKEALTEEQLEDANLGLGHERSSKQASCVATLSKPAPASTVVRPTKCATSFVETGMLPRTHGSALFTRGETQGLVVTTLGTGDDEQIIDALHGNFRSNFLLALQLPALLGW